jgi:hypothetical protein
LQQSQGKDADLTDQAAVCFDHCLRLDPADAGLRANARHNWELAKEFLRLNPKPPDRNQKYNPDQSEDNKPPRHDRPGTELADNGNDPNQARQNGKPFPDRQSDSSENPLATDERTPGKGNLAPLLDQDNLAAMSPEDAAGHLRQAVQRILAERREYRKQGYSQPSSHVLDW